jgi:uncharacterized membrane protein YsdA (DUF1294 family)
MKTELYLLLLFWLFTGMYGYIYWNTKISKRFRMKWRIDDVYLIPLFGLIGPLMTIIGYIVYKYKTKRLK